ncbi:sensor histidine kinase [Actinomadura luteofluorescens]|uniref:sensor histidine kinase n=1 Tax=Actinomadura luteofluorescens TaxID=46163 RepID=UPI003493FA08
MNRPTLDRLPLWVRLVATVLLLVTAALAVISTAGVKVLHQQLLAKIDAQLAGAAFTYPAALGNRPPQDKPAHGTSIGGWVIWAERRDANGKPVNENPPSGDPAQGPAVPENAAWLVAHEGHPRTVPGSSGHGSWRVLVDPLPDTSGWVVIAMGFEDLNGTISKLVQIDLTVGAIGLVLLAIASIVIVRASLRPLIKVEKTAAAIAAGDLSQRVPEHPPKTELGRLGNALNGMLTQIEAAFSARARSESAARRSEERMRRFVADAGHELRTPLSVIRAWTEYAHHGPRRNSADLEQILSTLGTEAARMSTLVEDLLLLARLDQQRPLESHPVDMLALAVDAARDARLLAPDRDIRLTVDDRADYTVTGDEIRLRQVLTNLTGNALTHTPSGTPVSITLGPGHLGRTAAMVLDVTDHGPGLTPDQAERVFERFYRTDTSRTRRTGGSGLGLAIVASLTTAHGGTVSVHSRPGTGATFHVTLPLANTDPLPERT